MTRDFTLSKYKALCKSLISSGYRHHRAGVHPGAGGGAIRHPEA